ncbi:MADS-box protein CMB2 [Bienertia sinuspersici]
MPKFLLLPPTKRLHHYISPGVELKKMYDEYQKIEGVDLWRKHYEQMQEHKRELLEDNNMLRREIRRRMGGYLEELTIGELGDLQQEMEDALVEIRNRKYHVIKNQTGTSRKKVKSLEEIHANLLRALEFGIVVDDDDDGGYEAASMYANNGPATASSNDMSHHNYHHQ